MFRGAHLGFEGQEFEDHLHSEEHGEDEVKGGGQLGDVIRLVAVLNGHEETTVISIRHYFRQTEPFLYGNFERFFLLFILVICERNIAINTPLLFSN